MNKQKQALLRAQEAMKVWTNLHAPEFCDPQHVKWANEIANSKGTLWYIAQTSQIISDALENMENKKTTTLAGELTDEFKV